jgi:flagellar biosynthetic protein FlhB
MENFDRTEPASPKRRQEYRERGEVAKSRDLASAVILLASLGGLAWAGEALGEELRAGMRAAFEALAEVRWRGPGEGWGGSLGAVALAASPVLGLAAAAAIAAHFGQTGLLFATKALIPDFKRLRPGARLRQMFSSQGLIELAKTLLKVTLVGAVVYVLVSREIEGLTGLGEGSSTEIAASLCALSLRVFGYGGMALMGLGLLDYAYQRWQLERKMRMTKHEVKEEFKRQEGDPLVKMRIRSKQRELARQRMMQAVKTADVVVSNPTHLAVALAYRPSEMAAPRVVAKGQGFIAERIKEIARENQIPVLEDRPLARALYKSVKVGREIPANLYRAVAEVLAYVYGRRGRGPDGRPLGVTR